MQYVIHLPRKRKEEVDQYAGSPITTTKCGELKDTKGE
jgi:hypothetical protein